MGLRQSDLKFVCSRIPQDVRRFMVEGRGLMLAGGFIRSVIEGGVPKDMAAWCRLVSLCADRDGEAITQDQKERSI